MYQVVLPSRSLLIVRFILLHFKDTIWILFGRKSRLSVTMFKFFWNAIVYIQNKTTMLQI